MARKPRIHRPTAFYHVMLRGNNGQDIFFSDADRCRLCLLLQQGIERFEHRIHGFCLMSNHIHLVVQTSATPLSRIIQHLATSYACYINRSQERVGHLFQGRFKAILVDANNYLTELIRYVHLNPVRAGMVPKPESYLWSGHSAYLGSTSITWLSQEWLLKKFDSHELSARKFYSDFVNKGIGKPVSQQLYLGSREGRILGDDSFIEEMLKESNSRKKVSLKLTPNNFLNIVAESLNVAVSDLQSRAKRSHLSQARGIAALLAREYEQLSIQALAVALAKDPGALSKSATAIELLSLHDTELRQAIDRVRHKVSLLSKD